MPMRVVAYASLTVLVLAAATSGARARDDANALQSECGAPDLSASAVDSCLERVRVLEETSPNADLQNLERTLEEREAASGPPVGSGRQTLSGAASQGGPPDQYQPYSRWAGMRTGAAEPDADENGARDADARSLDGTDPDEGSAALEGQPRRASGLDAGPSQQRGVDADDEPPVEDPPDSATPDDNPR
jgi:hypothetical protein